MKQLGMILGIGLLMLILSGCTTIASQNTANSSNLSETIIVTDTIQKGNYVTLYYRGTLDDGNVFDQTPPGQPATFQVGTGGLIKGFDSALMGMKIGEKKHIHIDAKDAYGEINPQAIVEVPQTQLTDANIPIKIGITVQSSVGSGKLISVDENAGTVKIDFNHPLAGKALNFDVEILKISAKP